MDSPERTEALRLLVFSTAVPERDLALEEALQRGLEEQAATPPTWRIWQATAPAVVLGTGQEHAREVRLDVAAAAGVPVLRRHSGGGAVLIGPGILNYSACYPYGRLPGSETITGAMRAALAPVRGALARLGVRTDFAGLSDLAVVAEPGESGGTLRKIAGNSQARKRRSVLVHGTLLADPDWGLLEALLAFPSRVPEYRAGRGHRDFLTSLEELGAPADLESFVGALGAELAAGGSPLGRTTRPSAAELEAAARLYEEKYSRAEWNLRR